MEPRSMGWGGILIMGCHLLSFAFSPSSTSQVATPTEGLKQAGCSRNSSGARLRSGRDAMTDVGQKLPSRL
jgi:hypothetical protein